ncbi:transmembrane and death domain protein 1 isoform X3 [Engystomops pustulosus]|uniref:transmembrane and death domain protein 1 isoform X3 n=1 Tax=Engystomops pustulosus TaxID=76066 RepID=UPI003AFA1A36
MNQYWVLILPLLLISKGLCEDTVADDIGPHMIMRISQLLSPVECQSFYLRITGPQKEYDNLLKAPPTDDESKERKRRDIELSKNLNLDKTMGIKKTVDELSRSSHKQKSSLIIYEDEKYGENMRQVRDLNTIRDEDWELIVERKQLPPYDRHLNEWCWSMIYGVIFGFLAAPLFASMIFLIIFVMHILDTSQSKMSIKIENF